MHDNNEPPRASIKPVFPLLYLSVFVWTVVSMYSDLMFEESIPIVQAIPGDINQQAMWVIIAFFSFTLCLYNVLYYAVLEFFEHHEGICTSTPKKILIAEFIVRFLLVATVALKVIKYNLFDSLFVFASMVCFLLVLWLLLLKSYKISDFTVFDLIGSSIVMVFAFLASYILSVEPAAQIDYAIPLLAISFFLTIAFLVMIAILLMRFGGQFYELSKSFFVRWP